jgi:YVTN family beta-propeller protein
MIDASNWMERTIACRTARQQSEILVTRAFESSLTSSLSVLRTTLSKSLIAALMLVGLICPGAAEAQVVSYAFVPNWSGPTKAVVIDTTTHTIVPSSISTPSSPTTAAASPDGRVVYLLSDRLHVVDVRTRTITGSLLLGLAPQGTAFTRDGSKAYIVNGGTTASISIVDVFTDSLNASSIDLPDFSYPRYIEITPDGLMAYVTSENGLYPVNLTTNTPGTLIPTGPLNGIAILADGQTAFVAERTTNRVLVVDLATGTVDPTTIPVGNQPEGMALSPDKTVIYVVNAGDPGSVSVIDVATRSVVATVPVPPGDDALAVSFTPDGRYAYVTANDGNNVIVIDTATHTVHASSPIGPIPDADGRFANFITPNIITNTGGPLTIANDAALEAAGFRAFVPMSQGTLRLSGDWTTTRHLSMLYGAGILDTNGFNATIAGNIVNGGELHKIGAGTLTLTETSTATHAATRLYDGDIVVNGTHNAPLQLYAGTLAGTGSLGDVVVHGTVSPGGNATGILHAAQLWIGTNDTFLVQINGTTAGTDYDRLEASGSANINNATLTVQAPVTLPPAAQFTILTNATGRFMALPEGGVVFGGGKTFRISYVGGDGNDVVLTYDAGEPDVMLSHVPAIDEDTGLVVIPFTVSDDVVPPSGLIATATSHNLTLLPAANLSVVGTGASRAIHLTTAPNLSGLAGITLRVTDGVHPRNLSFAVIVNAVNDAPTIAPSPMPAQSVPENMPMEPVMFEVSDIETDAALLTVTATSSNQAIVPDANLTVGGSGATRSIAAMPQVGVRGDTTITLTVTDPDGASTSESFVLTVTERTYYLAEGATGVFFDTDILLANPNAVAAPVVLRFLKEDGTSIVQNRTLAATSRTTIKVDEVEGLEATSLATIVTSTDALPIVVERTMRWDASGYGAHTEKATAGAAPAWYFAEGAQGFFSTYFLLANPHGTANTAHVTYFREGAPVITRDYPLGPGSRTTIDAGADVELRDQAFGARITFDLPGVAERAMYFGTDPIWLGGHASAGATTPASDWFLAEGATGTWFTTFVLIANPNDEPADVTVRYLPETGMEVTKTYRIEAGQRLTRNIAFEDAALANAAVATHVQSTRPVVVERAQYWGQPAWIEAHNSFGVTVVAPRWGLAEGRVGGAETAQTYILLANAGAEAASVTITFLRTDGTTVVKTYDVGAASRFNVAIVPGPGSMVPELADESFGARIESTQPIVVERSVYSDANGITWAAGTNATATRLP